MDTETEKLCLEEIDHLILDTDKKVSLVTISNNWNVPNKDGEIILEKWLKTYSGDRKIAKEYLIRGVDLNGNVIITVVSEKNLSKVEKMCPKFTKILYSIEIGSLNGKSLNITEPASNKYVSLKLKSARRNIKVNPIIVDKSIKKEVIPPKKANPFGTFQSKASQSKEAKPDSASSSKDAKVKEEKVSPKQSSPKKKQPPSKAQQGKSSISSFFASKPTSSNASKADKLVADATVKVEKVQIKDEPVDVNTTNDTKATQKRPHSNASDSNDDFKATEKKQTKKKPKLEQKSKHSRLMQLCDSSSEEDEASNNKDRSMDIDDEELVVKKEKENKTPSPEKTKSNGTPNGSSSGKHRAKVKKTITKTYVDEDGFVNTVKEVEEVSCSEEEAEVTAPPPKKPAPTMNQSTAATTKKKISPQDGKKQGSILSFFSKK
ncbi:DNA polymerase delta subunit 3 [Contarinia nasturtii]|uniref:DNA polymerase delta subunit 3 n=1 Tax=Contarinia nasturtii TaxID=265458 RepID=UPI0012D3CF8C|nr:DNA polymerase delta subunit 3 [Contarinia nasturtii]